MKKLIFRKFAQDTVVFFSTACLIMGLIVWTLQAINYFDFVTQDGHGIKVYFQYTIFNFPKIIHRLLPFIYFISLFYVIINYETRNELSIFWINGISKINFANKIIFLSILLMIFQIWLGSFFSPYTQFKSREFLKNSNIDFFSSLIKEGKFINAVKGLTIFIDKKNDDGSFSNIYLDDSSKNKSKMIYAKNGIIIDDNKKKIFKLFQGKIINNENSRINVFEFDQIDFNLADFTPNTITMPKIQEIPSSYLINCLFFNKENDFDLFRCESSILKASKQELFKRFYKPFYIPVISILCCLLLLVSKNHINYERNKKIIFLLTFLLLILSETSLRYSSTSNLNSLIYLFTPWTLFFLIYSFYFTKVKNV